MSSPKLSTEKSNLDPNYIEEDNYNLLQSTESEFKQLKDSMNNFSVKNFEQKKEIFEFNSHEVYWSTEDYFRIVYFKLNEIKQFKDSKKPAEFKNIPIEFSETNRKMNLDLKFEFEEEKLNLNFKFTHFLKQNRIENKEKSLHKKDVEEDFYETPNEFDFNVNNYQNDKSDKMDVIGEKDYIRGGSENKFYEKNDIQEVNIEIDDINQINLKKESDIKCFDEKSSSNNYNNIDAIDENSKFITENSILRGRAKKNKPKFAKANENKNNKINNDDKNDINNLNLRSLKTLELNSDLTEQEYNSKANNKNKNKTPVFNSVLNKNIIKDDESNEMDLHLNFNEIKSIKYNKATEGQLIIENDLYKKQNLFNQVNQNYPNAIENLYSDDNNEIKITSTSKNNNKTSSVNSPENKLKRNTRARKSKEKTEFIDLTDDKQEENSANAIIDINSKNKGSSSNQSNNSSKNFNFKNSKHKKNLSKNMMDQEISEPITSNAEGESKSYKNINSFEKDTENNPKIISASENNEKIEKVSSANSNKNQTNANLNQNYDCIFERLEKYEINPLARNDEDPEEFNNEKYSRVIQNKLDFLNIISKEEIKFDLKINTWKKQKQNFEYFTGKKPNLIKHTSETICLEKYEDIIYENKDFYLLKLIFSSKKKAKPANKEFCGIQNEKNTCYLNSIFQILFNLKILRKQIFSILANEGTPLFFMQQAFFEMQKQSKSDIRLLGFIRAMQWDESVQNDFAEIFFFVFEMLSEYEKNVKGESLLDMHCTGIYRTHIKCREINHESSKPEPFLLLQLDITGCKNLIQCFEKFLSVEKMTEENKYELEDRSKHEAIKSLHFETLPPILFLSLMRFEYKEQIRKKCDKVEYEEFIDLGDYIAHNKNENENEDNNRKKDFYKYELFGVVVHDGNAEGGHYYTFFKERQSRNWIKFNDSKTMYVSEIDVFETNFGGKEKQVAVYENGDISVEYNGNSRTAYILVYLQQDKIEEILADVTEADLNETLLEFLNNPSSTNTKNNFKNNNKKNAWNQITYGLDENSNEKTSENKPLYERRINTRSSFKTNNSSTLNQLRGIESKIPVNVSYDFVQNMRNNIIKVGTGQDIFYDENAKSKKPKSKKNLISLAFNKENTNKNLISAANNDLHNFIRDESQDKLISDEILKYNNVSEKDNTSNNVNINFSLRDQKIMGKLNTNNANQNNNNNNNHLKRKNNADLPKISTYEKKMAPSVENSKANHLADSVQILLEVDRTDEDFNFEDNKNFISKETASASTNSIFKIDKFDYKTNYANSNITNVKNSDLTSSRFNYDFIERKKKEGDSLKIFKLKLFMNNYKNKFLVEDFSLNSNEIKTNAQNFIEELIEKNKSKNPALKEIIDYLNLENLKLVLLTNLGICLEIIDTSNSKALTQALNKFHSKEIFLAIYHFTDAFLPSNSINNFENEIIITVNFIDKVKTNVNEINFHNNQEVRLPLVFYADKKNLDIDHLYCLLLERINNSSSKFQEISLDDRIYIVDNNENERLIKISKYTNIKVVDLKEFPIFNFKNKKFLRIICETKDYKIEKSNVNS